MRGADLGAIHLFPRARRRGLRVEGAQPRVGLFERIGVDARSGPDTAVAAAARGSAGISWRRGARPRSRRLIVILEPRDIAAAVAPQLSLDPVDGGAIAVGALAPIAEARESLDGRLVTLEVEPGDELGDEIGRGRLRRIRLRERGSWNGESGDEDEKWSLHALNATVHPSTRQNATLLHQHRIPT